MSNRTPNPNQTVMNRIFARLLLNSSENRNNLLLTRDLRLLNRDSDDDSDDYLNPNSEDLIRGGSYSENSDSDAEEHDHLLQQNERKIINENEWLKGLKHQPRKPIVMRHLVLDFLMRASMKDVAETFAKEAGIEVGEILESKINKFVNQISELLDENKIGEIEGILDSIDPEIRKGNFELIFDLKVWVMVLGLGEIVFEDFLLKIMLI
jgi:hypothetical protein